ncbi:MAG: hypothetical protein FWH43_04635 [Endomicrobia bacterium]|nr:hypothetical protein [Endomicrobiia bacterium]
MEIKKKYFEKYLHSIAIEQIAEDYLKNGYSVSKEQHIGKYRADLVAKKGDETIVIEVKSGKMTPEKKDTIKYLSDYVREQGNYKFLVVFAALPEEKKLEIDNIESLLLNYIIHNLSDEIDELSTHSTIDEISEINIDEIQISEKSIFAKGTGIVDVELQFGSDGDQDRDMGFRANMNFPFEFEIILKYNNGALQIDDVKKLEFDTSDYYE